MNLGGFGVAGDVVQGLFKHQHEVALAVDGEAMCHRVGVNMDSVPVAAQHAVGCFPHQDREVIGAVALTLHEACDVAHGVHGFVGDVFDLGKVGACVGSVRCGGEKVLGDEGNAAEATADLVVKVLSDACAQALDLLGAGFALMTKPEEQDDAACCCEADQSHEDDVLPAGLGRRAFSIEQGELVLDLSAL